jgi:hypothetical protein
MLDPLTRCILCCAHIDEADVLFSLRKYIGCYNAILLLAVDKLENMM